MNRRERLRRCYNHEELDRPAVYTRTGYARVDPTYERLRAYMEANTERKVPWPSLPLDAPYPEETFTEPFNEDWDRMVWVLKTPKGELRRSSLMSRKGQPGLHETFYLKDTADAEKYLSLPLPEIRGDCASFFEADARIGDAGIVDVSLGHNPGGVVAELFGSETFAMISRTDRDVVHALCEREMNRILRRLRFLIDNGVGPYFATAGEEYIVPPLHGREDFDDFNVRYDKPIADAVHDAGGRLHIHSHGRVKQVFEGFLEIGADVLHPFEGPPMGDITPREAKDLARERLCLEGNIQIDRMYDATPDEIRAETEALIRECFDDGRGLIVCPTASPYIRGGGETAYPQYEAMVETVLGYRG